MFACAGLASEVVNGDWVLRFERQLIPGFIRGEFGEAFYESLRIFT